MPLERINENSVQDMVAELGFAVERRRFRGPAAAGAGAADHGKDAEQAARGAHGDRATHKTHLRARESDRAAAFRFRTQNKQKTKQKKTHNHTNPTTKKQRKVPDPTKTNKHQNPHKQNKPKGVL